MFLWALSGFLMFFVNFGIRKRALLLCFEEWTEKYTKSRDKDNKKYVVEKSAFVKCGETGKNLEKRQKTGKIEEKGRIERERTKKWENIENYSPLSKCNTRVCTRIWWWKTTPLESKHPQPPSPPPLMPLVFHIFQQLSYILAAFISGSVLHPQSSVGYES